MAGQPLIITDDELLLDDLLRVAAAAGVDVTHTREPDSRTLWRAAGVVLIDAALVSAAVDARPAPARRGWWWWRRARRGSELWELCVRLGVDRTVLLPESEEIVDRTAVRRRSGRRGQRAVHCRARRLRRGRRVGIRRLDRLRGRRGARTRCCWSTVTRGAPGLDVLLGIETEPGLRWEDLAAPSGRLQVDALRRALPGVAVGSGRVAVLCHGRGSDGDISPDVLTVVLDAGRRMGAATVIDLPRQPGPVADRVLEQADLVVLVTPADVRGCWAAERVCARIRQFGTTARAWSSADRRPAGWAPPNWPMCWACRCSRGCGPIRRCRETWRSAWRSAPTAAGRSPRRRERCCRRCGLRRERGVDVE